MVKTSPHSAGSAGSIRSWGAKILHASGPKNQNTKQKQYCKISEDFKDGPDQSRPKTPPLRVPLLVIRKPACCTLSDSPPPPHSNKLYSSLKKKKSTLKIKSTCLDIPS